MKKLSRREFLAFSAAAILDLYTAGPASGQGHVHHGEIRVSLDEEPELVFEGQLGVLTYPVVAGRKGYGTPRGEFSVLRKVHKPSWCPNPERRWVQRTEWYMEYYSRTGNRCIPYSHPNHPLGPWKLIFEPHGYAIHGKGDKALDKGSRYASHGCIRMRDEDICELAPMVGVGTPVLIG